LRANVAANNPRHFNYREKGFPMKATNDRFIETYKQQDAQNRTYVLVDRETGVNYLLTGFMASSGVSCTGMTVLQDADGNPIVTPVEE
jgi:hypothetical protein